jgi:hypothetical protein
MINRRALARAKEHSTSGSEVHINGSGVKVASIPPMVIVT